jgi:hypothetical protein
MSIVFPKTLFLPNQLAPRHEPLKTYATNSLTWLACTPQNTNTCLTRLKLRASSVHVSRGVEHSGSNIRGVSEQRTSKRRLYESARMTACRGASSTLSFFSALWLVSQNTAEVVLAYSWLLILFVLSFLWRHGWLCYYNKDNVQ